MAAWISIIGATMQVAKSHHQLAEDLSVNVINQLKAVAARKEEARKKVMLILPPVIPFPNMLIWYMQHLAFYQKLKAERDKTYSEKDKAKNAYDDACANIQNIRAKMAKGTGDHDKVRSCLTTMKAICVLNLPLYCIAREATGSSSGRL